MRFLIRICAAVVAAIGLFALASWVGGAYSHIDPALTVPMAPSTAVLFLLFAVAAFFSAHRPQRPAVYRTGVAINIAGAAFVLCLLVLSFLGVRLEVEHLGFAVVHPAGIRPIGHMSSLTAIGFLLAALSYLAMAASTRERIWLVEVSAGLAASVTMLGLMLAVQAFVWAPIFTFSATFTPPAELTVVAVIFLGTSLIGLALRPEWLTTASPEPRLSLTPGYLALFIFAVVSVAGGGFFSYRNDARQFQAAMEQQLSAIKDLKVKQLVQWREERLADGETLRGNITFVSLVKRVLGPPGDKTAERELRDWLRNIRTAYGYDRVYLLDAPGAKRMAFPETADPPAITVQQMAAEVLRIGTVQFQDFYRDSAANLIRLAVLAPIMDQLDGQPLGTVVLQIDPRKFLYPFIQSWPIPSRSAETLLLRRDGNDVLYLNDLRFASDAALNLRYPLAQTDLPAAMAALGQQGIVSGRDYQGVSVIGAVDVIPGSPWFLVARIDQAEAYEPLQRRLWTTILLVGSLLATAIVMSMTIWRRQQRIHAQEKLANEGEKARLMGRFFELPFIGMARTSPETKVWLQVNDRLCDILGHSRDELHIMTWVELTHPDDLPVEMVEFNRVLRGEADGYTLEKRFVRRDGSVVFAAVDVKVVRRTDGTIEYFVKTVQDITERKLADAQSQHSLAELERSNNELEQFAYVASHDLQEPLRMVTSYTQLLGERYRDRLDDKANKYIHYAVDGAIRMQTLINDLLVYSRIGRSEQEPTPTDTNPALGEALRNLNARIAETGAVITNVDLPTVPCDGSQLTQVFQNLLSNAIKFRGETALRIHVSAHDNPDEWVFAVKDNGIGIEPQHAERVFQLFQRLHSREEYPGTGIGLALCQRIVQRGGGRIWFESEPGKGTTFFFTIPKHPGEPSN